MAVKPILHRIIVRQDKLSDRDGAYAAAKRAGIEIIETESKREQAAIDTGTVLDIGPTAFKDFGVESPIAIGDKIVYAKYGGKAIEDPDTKETVVALNDEDVIAILK